MGGVTLIDHESYSFEDFEPVANYWAGIQVEADGVLRIIPGTPERPMTTVQNGPVLLDPGATLVLEAGSQFAPRNGDLDALVPEGATLRMEQGSELLVPEGRRLVVRGTLDADRARVVQYDSGLPAVIEFHRDHVVREGRERSS